MNVLLHLVLSVPLSLTRVLRIEFRFLSKHFTNWAIPLACSPFSYFRGSSIPLSGWVGYADWLVSSWDLLVSASPSWVYKYILPPLTFSNVDFKGQICVFMLPSTFLTELPPPPRFWLWYYSLVFAIWIKTHTWMNTISLSCEVDGDSPLKTCLESDTIVVMEAFTLVYLNNSPRLLDLNHFLFNI